MITTKQYTCTTFKANYDKILDILNENEEKSNFLQQIRLPKLTDKELTTVNLTAEYMGVDSEYQLFRIFGLKDIF